MNINLQAQMTHSWQKTSVLKHIVKMEKIGPSFSLWAQLRQFFKPSAYSSEP